MKFAYYIIVIPVIALLIWLLYGVETSAEGISFAPYPQDCFNPQVVLLLCVAVGYIIGKLNSWFNYLPLRRDLRLQKKANKALNIEQAKLNNTVNDLKQNLAGLQEKAAANPLHYQCLPYEQVGQICQQFQTTTLAASYINVHRIA